MIDDWIGASSFLHGTVNDLSKWVQQKDIILKGNGTYLRAFKKAVTFLGIFLGGNQVTSFVGREWHFAFLFFNQPTGLSVMAASSVLGLHFRRYCQLW